MKRRIRLHLARAVWRVSDALSDLAHWIAPVRSRP